MAATRQLTFPAGVEPADLERGSIYFIGTATVLLRFGGFTLLTDPNFLHAGDHVHLGYGLIATRRTNPALEIHELPPLDLVLLSHMHGDHFDRIAARELDKALPIVTTPHAARSLRRKGFRAPHPLRTWEALEARKGAVTLRITATPGRHGPPLLGRLLPPVMGSMLEFQGEDAERPALRLYISGDTLVYGDLHAIPRRYPDIDLMLLHLGGTRAFGVLVTMDAAQGIEAIRIIAPRVTVPIHYDDYTVFKSPLADFLQRVRAAGLEHQVQILSRGETFAFATAELRGRR